MEQNKKTSAKDFFLYLGAVVALYISTVSIIALWFRVIDEIFPDPLKYSDPYSTGISLAIASLFVIFPIYIIISWILHRDEAKYPEKRELGIRKWLIYLTLFIAGMVIVIDLITLINTFLSGNEITSSFIAKIFVILLVIGTIFIFYLYKVRAKDGISKSLAKKLTWGTLLFVIASIVIGFVVMGSPQTQRMKRIDQERVSDLSNIQRQIVNYWQTKEILPETLSDLEDQISGFIPSVDPETEEPYAYRVVSSLAFEICATFNLSNKESEKDPRKLLYPVNGITGESWEHEAGEVCFERTIDIEKYKLREPTLVF